MLAATPVRLCGYAFKYIDADVQDPYTPSPPPPHIVAEATQPTVLYIPPVSVDRFRQKAHANTSYGNSNSSTASSSSNGTVMLMYKSGSDAWIREVRPPAARVLSLVPSLLLPLVPSRVLPLRVLPLVPSLMLPLVPSRVPPHLPSYTPPLLRSLIPPLLMLLGIHGNAVDGC